MSIASNRRSVTRLSRSVDVNDKASAESMPPAAKLNAIQQSIDDLKTAVQELLGYVRSDAEGHPYCGDYLITLRQAAALARRKKCSLEHYKYKSDDKRLPEPEIVGSGGKPSLYLASELLPWITRIFGVKVPDIRQLIRDI